MRICRAGLSLLLSLVPTFAAEHAPLPTALLNAKTVYLLNSSGDAAVFDRLYEKLKAWGRWEVVADGEDADLLLVFGAANGVNGAIASASSGPGYAYSSVTPILTMPRLLAVYDMRSKQQLLLVSCERRLSGGYTAGVLVNRMRKRIEGDKRAAAKDPWK